MALSCGSKIIIMSVGCVQQVIDTPDLLLNEEIIECLMFTVKMNWRHTGHFLSIT